MPCSQSSTVSRSGQRVRARRSRRSGMSASSTRTVKGVGVGVTAASRAHHDLRRVRARMVLRLRWTDARTGRVNRPRHGRPSGQPTRHVWVLAVLTGAATGLGVACFDRAVREQMFDHLLDAPLWVQAVGPVAGLVVAALALRYLSAGASPATADEY